MVALVMVLVGFSVMPAFGADLHEPHIGTTCESEGLWHFVHNQIDEGAAAGELTATFSISGEITVTAYKVLNSTQHYEIVAAGTLLSASDNIPEGRLVLSSLDCDGTTTTTKADTTTTTKPDTTTSSSIVDTTSTTKPDTTTTTEPSTTTTKPDTTTTTMPDTTTSSSIVDTTSTTKPDTTTSTRPDSRPTTTTKPPRTTTTDHPKGDNVKMIGAPMLMGLKG